MARIFGIDLGTTNSLIAYMDGQSPRVIPGRNGRAMVPSVVALTDNGLLVGDPAKEYLVRRFRANRLFRETVHGQRIG